MNFVPTVQHLAEWDHGIEPSPLDASFGSNDQNEFKASAPTNLILESPKRIAKRVRSVASKFIHDVIEENHKWDTMNSDGFIVPTYFYPEDRM